MFSSLKLGRLGGIPLYVHWTFWLLPLLIVTSQPGAIVLRLAALFAMFGCVVLHELGHALAARLFGIRTRDITLYPIGGVARLERMSEKPGEELVIAIAGPAVNVVIAGVLGAGSLLAATVAPDSLPSSMAAEFTGSLIFWNIVMVLFNMIPAFPMDGGRVFRALLGFLVDHVTATRVAVTVGSVLAVVLPLVVFWHWPQFANPFLIVIAFFVITSGQRELAAVVHRDWQRRRAAAWEAAAPYEETPNAADDDSHHRPPVTVYIWDPRHGLWIRQGQAR